MGHTYLQNIDIRNKRREPKDTKACSICKVHFPLEEYKGPTLNKRRYPDCKECRDKRRNIRHERAKERRSQFPY